MANSYVKSTDQMEHVYPLRTYVCEHCFLVQVHEFETLNIYSVIMPILVVSQIAG